MNSIEVQELPWLLSKLIYEMFRAQTLAQCGGDCSCCPWDGVVHGVQDFLNILEGLFN